MATVRYAVDGVGSMGENANAWFPMPTLSPIGATHGGVRIYGSAGTTPVPSPPPRFDRTASHLADGAGGPNPYRNGSDVAPDVFYPQVWFTDIRNLPIGPSSSGRGIHYMPGRVAPIPPPVVPQAGVSGVAMAGRPIGRVMRWPRAITRWRNGEVGPQ